MRKVLSLLFVAVMVVTTMGMSVSASAVSKSTGSKPHLCFYFSDEGMYEVSQEQFNEIIENKSLDEVVKRDGLAPISPTPDSLADFIEIEKEVLPTMTRATGRWDISSDTILAGYRVTYSKPGGSSFVVASGEELMFSIDLAESAQVTLGLTGTINKSITEYVDINKWGGITIGTDKVGSYKALSQNKGIKSLRGNGIIPITMEIGI